jgi:hypothetical protein
LVRLYDYGAYGTKRPADCDLGPIRDFQRRLAIAAAQTGAALPVVILFCSFAAIC